MRPVFLPYAIPFADLILAHNKFFANIEGGVDAPDEYVAEIARVQFELVFRDYFIRLLQLAECEHDKPAKQWAAALLAWFDGNLGKHRKKLKELNPAYKRQSRIGMRADVALPKSPVCEILQEELRTAERYQSELLHLKKREDHLLVSVDKEAVERRLRDELVLQHLVAGEGKLLTRKRIREIKKRAHEAASDCSRLYPDEVASSDPYTWKEVARERGIPEEYWSVAELPPLSAQSEPDWWKFIWARLKAKKKEIWPRLEKSGEDRAKAKDGNLYLKDFSHPLRKHLRALAKAR